MKDHYLFEQNASIRLLKEWKKHGKIIIAYDYDDTVFDFHNKGHSHAGVQSLLRQCKEVGAYFIVWTGAKEDRYPEIIKHLIKQELPFDKINENMEFADFTGRKIFANIYLDDRGGLSSAYKVLQYAMMRMQEFKEVKINCGK